MSLDLRYAISFPWDYYRGLRAVADSAHPFAVTHTPDPRHVVFDLRTTRMLFDAGRYLFILIEAFRQAGVEVEVIKNRWFLARAGRKYWGRAALSMPSVEAQGTHDSSRSLVGCLSDHDGPHTRFLFGDAFHEPADVFPYPMHPQAYASANLDAVRDKRVFGAQPRIFFSGNVNHKYDNPILESKYGVVSRAKLIAAIQEKFQELILPQENEYSAFLSQLLPPNKHPLIINDLQKCPIPRERWLETLSCFDFFFCCPGVSHPNCHNAIEAMCAGTIPIIEFPELFTPPLTDGVNAITFRGLNGLSEAVERALALSVEQRRAMSQAAVQYYEQHLCVRRFIERWIQRGAERPIRFPYIPA